MTPSSRASIRGLPRQVRPASAASSERGGKRAGAVAGMDAGALDVLHDAADDDRLAVGDRVDVDLDRVLEILVDQQRCALGGVAAPARCSGAGSPSSAMTSIARPPSTYDGRTSTG